MKQAEKAVSISSNEMAEAEVKMQKLDSFSISQYRNLQYG